MYFLPSITYHRERQRMSRAREKEKFLSFCSDDDLHLTEYYPKNEKESIWELVENEGEMMIL